MVDNFVILTSNSDKIREINMIAPNIKTCIGRDIKEVLGTKDDVIIYKTLATAPGYVVEDTVLQIGATEIVDIKWKQNDLIDGTKIDWIVSLGWYYSSTMIKVYRGSVSGTIVKPLTSSDEDVSSKDVFGFDLQFVPDGQSKNLHELSLIGEKHMYSPRSIALKNLINDKPIFTKNLFQIPPWSGKYQNEN